MHRHRTNKRPNAQLSPSIGYRANERNDGACYCRAELINHVTLHPDTDNSKTMELSEASVNAVKMSRERKKLIRKQMKACHILLKHDGIRTASHVTKVKNNDTYK